ncbi:MAG: host attachment family protein [Alphaproteobacteria bacterium]|nr:host attachment family protein [Alphaproteobacteria bacterium]
MTNEKIPANTLVVVASGEIAKLFRQTSKDGVKLEFKEEFEPSNLDNEGPAGKRPPESSKQSTDEATFAKQLANELNRRVHVQDFEHLVLIADPRTLGEMRPLLHKLVLDKLVSEADKTLVNSPVEDIEKLLD